MFTSKDVADYYNTTLNHYKQWWDLSNNLSLHYGIWDENTRNFSESLINTNRILAELGKIESNDKVLDAGCGVGGAAIYLATLYNAYITGITLSERQVSYATQKANEHNLDTKVSFRIMDYTKTSFENESFDIVWACESVSSASDKTAFIREAYRVLKKGGRLIMSDFFLSDVHQEDPNQWIRKWLDTWSISDLVTDSHFVNELTNTGFTVQKHLDYTTDIRKSAQRLYRASLWGALPSELYNITHPNVSRFAKNHYRSGYYQWKALKEGLWRYGIIMAIK